MIQVLSSLRRWGSILLLVASWLGAPTSGWALPYGDPNQAYDRLPGTWETPHVKWASPLSTGRLKVLFIAPYYNSREVVELRQRLDLDYTVIMNVGKTSWSDGYSEGSQASPIQNGAEVLAKLSRERLDLKNKYDCIVIGKVSWEVIPKEVKDMILQHVERGTGLVYVSPHRSKLSWREETEEATTPDPQYDQLFRLAPQTGMAEALRSSLPFDALPLQWVKDEEAFKKLPAPPSPSYAVTLRRALSVRESRHGSGRILVLDYHDKGGFHRTDKCLTPDVVSDWTAYDLAHALLAKCVRFAATGLPSLTAAISMEGAVKAPAAGVTPADGWKGTTPNVGIARGDLPAARLTLTALSDKEKPQAIQFDYAVRDSSGKIVAEGRQKAEVSKAGPARFQPPLAKLSQGHYFVGLRLLDAAQKVLDFACMSFRVEDPAQVASVVTDKEYYQPEEIIQGKVAFAAALDGNLKVAARAVDAWGRTVFRTPVALDGDRKGGVFQIPVHRPLSRLWDLVVEISDADGVVASGKKWVGLPNWNFTDLMVPLIFSNMPEAGLWKGNYYTEQVRKYGINASNASVIYGMTQHYELFERAHLASVTYAMHFGEYSISLPFAGKEFEGPIAEISRMARAVAKNGQPLDPKEYPYVFPSAGYGAAMVNTACKTYLEASKFGSPYFFLTGEEGLAGEGQGDNKENSSFDPLTTKLFRDWCREEYKGDLKSLNEDWGSAFTDWGEIRGILLKQALKDKQLPRWVAFRHFMRSRIWTQFFIDWTDMMRTVIGYPINTGTNGHDQYDFSRLRNHMTSGKLYGCTAELNAEYRMCAGEELRQSFSGDQGFLVAMQSMMEFDYDKQTPLSSHRLPWKSLFTGCRGFDWETGSMTSPTFGGMACMTPDFSEPLPFFKNISEQILELQGGIANLCNTSKPLRSPVAIVWSAPNHYLSRLLPQQANGFTGGWLYNIDVDGGAIGDCLVLMKNLRIRPTFVSPEDVVSGQLQKRGFKAVLLPYSKGMGVDEAEALRAFVREGGLVIGSNEPGSYSRYGKKLKEGRLADLFPVLDRDHVVRLGKGVAAYLPNAINGYLGRMEKGDYAGSDSVAHLLKEHAKVATPIELLDASGKPRRDTLMPIFVKGSARYVGMMRASTSEGKETEDTVVQLEEKRHVWDVRGGKYLGFVDNFKIKLDLYPKFFALLPANPGAMKLTPEKTRVKQGEILRCTVEVPFKEGADEAIRKLGHVVHVEVLDPAGKELEWYRDNVLIEGSRSTVQIPISFSEKPGKYTLKARSPITGGAAEVNVQVE